MIELFILAITIIIVLFCIIICICFIKKKNVIHNNVVEDWIAPDF